MINPTKFREAISQLPIWRNGAGTRVSWVNWRNGYQLKMGWNDCDSFHCFIDFGKDSAGRKATMKAAFERFAPVGVKPRRIEGHGWTDTDYGFHSKEFISINEVAELAQALGLSFTIIYCQTCIGSRPIFETMGIPLVPGEMGKEWIAGQFVPYSTPLGMNL